jgi:hypothetical protein
MRRRQGDEPSDPIAERGSSGQHASQGAVLFRCRDCRCGVGNAVILGECPNCGGELERQSLASDAPYWESEDEFQARISRGQRTCER